MKRPLVSGLLIALAHAAIILSLGVQAARDRERLPRAWAQAVPGAASTRVHGRYLTFNLAPIPDQGLGPRVDLVNQRRVVRPTPIRLEARGGRLLAYKAASGYVDLVPSQALADSPPMIAQRLDYFLPPGAPDPMPLLRRGELWVEVGVPRQGPPRPLRLGKMTSGKIVPLAAGTGTAGPGN